MDHDTKMKASKVLIDLSKRTPQDKLEDALTARYHFQGLAHKLEADAEEKQEQAACFRARVDELTERIDAMQAVIQAL